MFKTHRRSAARLAAAGVAAGLLAAGALAGAGSAAADDAPPSSGGATATLDNIQNDLSDYATVATKRGETNHHERAGLFKMDLGGGKSIYTYCIDLFNGAEPNAPYQEVPWSTTSLNAPGKDKDTAGKITWILQHSFPKVDDLDALAAAAHSGPLTPQTAAAGTQVAIWRYSDDPKATANDNAAEKLAEYLYDSAVAVAEPAPSLDLTPAAVSGKSGDRIGPVTVHTTAGAAQVEPAADAPAGVKIVDAEGKPVSSVTDGGELYFDVAAGTPDGSSSVKVSATTVVPIGRAFAGKSSDGSPSQTMILADSDSIPVSATATASWAKKGPIPALTAQVDCAKSGVDVTAANQGDEDFTFQLAGKDYSVAPGATRTITVPVQEDQKYKIDIALPDGSVKTFEGVLDCQTAASPAPTTPAASTAPANQPSPATSGGSGDSGDNGGDLAETGSSNATPMIAGIAVALVVIGGGATFFVRRKKGSAASE